MTLQGRRERIATAALAGLLANPGGPIQHRPDTGWGLVNCAEEHVASIAVAMADELMRRLVALEAVIAGQPQGQGHYDPATQSVVRWHRFGDRTPPEDKLVLVRRAPNGLPGVTGQTSEEFDYLPDDLWAELPQPPRSES